MTNKEFWMKEVERAERFLGILMSIWLVVLLAFGVFLLFSCDGKLKKENERLREELARNQQYVPLKKDTIRDTVEVVSQKVVEVEKIKEILSNDDKNLIEDLNLKVKELESMQKIGTMTHDTVYLERKDSASDSPLYYKDAWAEFEYKDKRLRYNVKDSLSILVRKEFKHKFLWWKWGLKGYEVKAVNFNPHSTIRYNTFVKRKE